MRRLEKIDFKSMTKLENDRARDKRYCKHCGHAVTFPITSRLDKIICSYCAYYIYKTDELEFKDKLKQSIKKQK